MSPLVQVIRGARRLPIIAGALLRGGSLPLSMTFILTNRCNLRCEYCNIPSCPSDEMSATEFRGAIDELRSQGMIRASFSGGEPLLRRDAIDIIEHAHNLGLYTSLNTNGWLAHGYMSRLVRCLDMLMVSIDGPEAVHDAVRGRPGSYARAIAALVEARRAGVSTASICVVGPWNASHVEEVLTLARAHRFWAYFQPAYQDCFSGERGLRPMLDGGELRRLADVLARARERGFPVGASPGFLDRLSRGPTFGDCRSCAAGRFFATVMPDGRVVPCHLTSQGDYLNGRQVGFARAFFDMPHPRAGSGCAISPYQESDLIFHLDVRAIVAAVARARGAP